MRYVFGVDVGGTSIKMGFFTETGNLEETWEIPTCKKNNGVNILNDIADEIEAIIKKNKISLSDIAGIGLGVPGPVSEDGTVHKCVNLGWDVFNVEEALHNLTGIKVKAGNDANVAALGEMWKGGAMGCENVVMITLGTGVGGGIIQHGRMVSGVSGAAGEIGHITVNDQETVYCNCGKRGCLEQYTSATGIVRVTRDYISSHPEINSVLKDVSDLSCKEIFDAAKMEDPIAKNIVLNTGKILGKAMASIACVLDPDVFVIGGGVSRAGEILLEAIRKGYQSYSFHATAETKIEGAQMGNLAGIYGGAYLALRG